eukprot:1161214-Pelagomonas_calceolata.AAC.13
MQDDWQSLLWVGCETGLVLYMMACCGSLGWAVRQDLRSTRWLAAALWGGLGAGIASYKKAAVLPCGL